MPILITMSTLLAPPDFLGPMAVSTDQLYAETLSGSGIGSFVWDLTTQRVRCNGVLAAVLGLPAGQTVADGAVLLSVIAPEDVPALDAALDKARETGTALRHDLRVIHPESGLKRRVVLRAMYHNDPAAGGMILVGLLADVTVRDEAHASLRASEERHRLIFDASPVPMFIVDASTGRFQQVNEAAARLMGYSLTELELMEPLELITPDGRALATQLFATARPGLTLPEILPVRRRDGSVRFVDVTVDKTQLRDTPVLIVAADDVTERLEAEAQVRESMAARRAQQQAIERQAAVLDTVLSNIPVAIDIIGTDGTIEYVNRACEELLGWTLEDMRTTDVMAEVYPDPEYRARVTASLEAELQGSHDWVVRTRSGVDRTVAWVNVRLADGRTIGLGTDVTDTRRREIEEARFAEQMEQAQKLESLGVLAGGIAHDFNNLLVGILGNAGLAEGLLPPDSPAAPLVGEVRVVAARAADLTRQLLAYAGKGSFVVEALDVSAVVEEMAGLMHTALSKRASLETTLTRGLPPVRADATQLRQIVMNLITNASEALADGAGRISLRTGVMRPDAAFRQRAIGGETLVDGEYVFIEVEDTGCGMSDDTRARIFDPFFTTKFAGRGLGLAATLGIVRSHGGAILVDSQLERGTTFRLLLPAVEAVIPAAVPAPDVVAWHGNGVALLADDEVFVRRVLKRSLERAGFTVVEAEDGREALDLVTADPQRFSLAFLDLTMPRLAGDAALAEIKKLRPDLPAVLCSGYSEDELDPALVALPGVRFLQKPFTMDTIGAALRSACEDVGMVIKS